jgi:hypothetical protein
MGSGGSSCADDMVSPGGSGGGGCMDGNGNRIPGCSPVNPNKKSGDFCGGVTDSLSCNGSEGQNFGLNYLTNDPVKLKKFGWEPVVFGEPVLVCKGGFGVGQIVYQRVDQLNKCETHFGVRKVNPFKSIQDMSNDPIYCVSCKDMKPLNMAVYQFRDDINPPQVWLINKDGERVVVPLVEFLASDDCDYNTAAKYMHADYPNETQKYYTIKPGGTTKKGRGERGDFRRDDFGRQKQDGFRSGTGRQQQQRDGFRTDSRRQQQGGFRSGTGRQQQQRDGFRTDSGRQQQGGFRSDSGRQQQGGFRSDSGRQQRRDGDRSRDLFDRDDLGRRQQRQGGSSTFDRSRKTDNFGRPLGQQRVPNTGIRRTQLGADGRPVSRTTTLSSTTPGVRTQRTTVTTPQGGSASRTTTTRPVAPRSAARAQATRQSAPQQVPVSYSIESVVTDEEPEASCAEDVGFGRPGQNMLFRDSKFYNKMVEVEADIEDKDKLGSEESEFLIKEIVGNAFKYMDGYKSSSHSTATVANVIKEGIDSSILV